MHDWKCTFYDQEFSDINTNLLTGLAYWIYGEYVKYILTVLNERYIIGNINQWPSLNMKEMHWSITIRYFKCPQETGALHKTHIQITFRHDTMLSYYKYMQSIL